jgi:hypothetical protein
MISDEKLMQLKPSSAAHFAEFRRVESALDTAMVWLKLHARTGDVVAFERLNTDLEQALTELWQLASIK